MMLCYHRPRIKSVYIMCKLVSKTIHLGNCPFSTVEELEEGCNSTAVNEDNSVEVAVVHNTVREAVQTPLEVSARESGREVVNSPAETLVAHMAQLLVAGRIPPEEIARSFPVGADMAAEDNRLGRHGFLALVMVLVYHNSGLLKARTAPRP